MINIIIDKVYISVLKKHIIYSVKKLHKKKII